MRIGSLRLVGLVMSTVMLGACGSSASPATAGGAAPSVTSPAVDYYAAPPLSVRQILLTEGEAGNPRELHLFVPEANGRYPLLQFQHGFTSDVDTYTELLAQLAGFGFVVVAPQMYGSDPSSAPSVTDETTAAVGVLAWAQANLNNLLAARLKPSFEGSVTTSDTGLFGHSRGGQVAWRMLFDHPTATQARAIAGVDPVDGNAPPFPPGGTGELVTDDAGAFHFPFASLILGTGLGGSGVPGFECAPTVRNYSLFYNASQPPRYEVVASDYGHNDMTNGETPDVVCTGATDSTRHLMRTFVAGQLAAYFSSVLKAQDAVSWLTDRSAAPIATTGRFEK